MPDQVNCLIEALNNKFKNIFSEYHITTLSNMLGFYYSMNKSKDNINNFVTTVVEKLRIYIGDKKLLNDDFAVTLSLFVVSITNDAGKPDNEYLARDLSEIILSELYNSQDPEFKNKLRCAIKTLLSSINIRETIDVLYNKPTLLMNLIMQSLKQLPDIYSRLNKYQATIPSPNIKEHNSLVQKMDNLLAKKNLKAVHTRKEVNSNKHVTNIQSSGKNNESKGRGC